MLFRLWVHRRSTGAAQRVQSMVIVVALAAFGMLAWPAAAHERFLEIIEVEEVSGPALHLSLLNREFHQLEAELNDAEEELEDAREYLEDAEERQLQNARRAVVRAERNVQNAKGRLKQLMRDIDARRHRTLYRVHGWDGFAQQPFILWYTDRRELPSGMRAGAIVQGKLSPIYLYIPHSRSPEDVRLPIEELCISERDRGHSAPENKVRSYTMRRGRASLRMPEGFRPFSTIEQSMPWATRDLVDTRSVRATVSSSDNPSVTMLRLDFGAGSDRLSHVQYRVFALDRHGGYAEELTPEDGVLDYALGPRQEAIRTYLDPKRRYAYGFRVEIVEAGVYALRPVQQPRRESPRR